MAAVPIVAIGAPAVAPRAAAATVAATRAARAGGPAQDAGRPAVRAKATPPCGRVKRPPVYRHIVWIVLENQGYGSVMAPGAAPYLDSLAKSCGLATNYVAVTHPSLPNYIALTSGTTDGVAADLEPSQFVDRTANLFQQLRGNWHALEESMPTACDKVTTGSYAARHNPAVYYSNLAATCRRNDVPLRLPLALGSAFTFVTPNICDDMHSCPIATGSSWLARYVPDMLGSPQYRAGNTALFITFDESDNGPANQVATVVVAPSVPRGSRSGARFTHYSLLRTTEQLLHLPLLGAARTAPSMATAFHL